MTVHEPDWDDDDRDAVFAYDQARAASCSGCGGPTAETTDIEREDLYDAEVIACHRCAAGDRTVNAYRSGGGDMAGVRVHTFERPPYQPRTVTPET